MKTYKSAHENHYRKLLLMMLLSFISMYLLMYAMVDVFANVYTNVNQFYMALLMTAPMMLIELMLMRKMYANKRMNRVLMGVSLVLLFGSFFLIRHQTAVNDRQFLRSMIPHHAGAILMVEGADLSDPEVRELAKNIISSQQKEIDFMKAKLKALDSKR